METLIKFRLLADQLSDKECNFFLMKLIEFYGPNFFISSLFHHFVKDNNKINETINYISNIIKQEKMETNNHQILIKLINYQIH